MKRLCAVAGGMAIAALLAAPAKAQTPQQTVGSILIKFPVPAGQCEVGESTKPGAFFRKFMSEAQAKEGLTVLSIHADCGQFERFKKGGGAILTEYSIYAAPTLAIQNNYTSDFIERACVAAESLKKQSGNDFIHGGVNVSNTAHLGKLAEEKDVCYTGTLARVTTLSGVDGLFASVTANIVVNGKLIHYQALGSFSGTQSVIDLLNKHKANTAAFMSANTK